VGGYAWGEKVKSKMLAKEGIQIKKGKILDPDVIYRF